MPKLPIKIPRGGFNWSSIVNRADKLAAKTAINLAKKGGGVSLYRWGMPQSPQHVGVSSSVTKKLFETGDYFYSAGNPGLMQKWVEEITHYADRKPYKILMKPGAKLTMLSYEPKWPGSGDWETEQAEKRIADVLAGKGYEGFKTLGVSHRIRNRAELSYSPWKTHPHEEAQVVGRLDDVVAFRRIPKQELETAFERYAAWEEKITEEYGFGRGIYDLSAHLKGQARKAGPLNAIPPRGKPYDKLIGHHPGWAQGMTERDIGSDFTAGQSYTGGIGGASRTWAKWFSTAFSKKANKILKLQLWKRSPYHQRKVLSEALNVPVKSVSLSNVIGKERIMTADLRAKVKAAQGTARMTKGSQFWSPEGSISIGTASLEQAAGGTVSGSKGFLKARHSSVAYHEAGEIISLNLKRELNRNAARLKDRIAKRYGTMVETKVKGGGALWKREVSPKGKRLEKMVDERLEFISGEAAEHEHATKHVLDLEGYVFGRTEEQLGTSYLQTFAKTRLFEVDDFSTYMGQIRAGRRAAKIIPPRGKPYGKIVGHHPGRMQKITETVTGSDFIAGESYGGLRKAIIAGALSVSMLASPMTAAAKDIGAKTARNMTFNVGASAASRIQSARNIIDTALNLTHPGATAAAKAGIVKQLREVSWHESKRLKHLRQLVENEAGDVVPE